MYIAKLISTMPPKMYRKLTYGKDLLKALSNEAV